MNENILKAIAYLNLVLAEHGNSMWTEDVKALNVAITTLNRIK